ncbi:hypothetical protein ACJJTC_011405 [Scirpophaga incertulas]
MKINFHDVLVGGDGSGGMTSCILRMNPISRVIFNSLLDLNGVELKGSSPSPPSAVACIPEIRDRCVNYIDVWKNPTDLCQVETWEYFLTLKNTHKMSLNLLVFDVETKLAEDLVRIERLLGRYVWKLLGRDGTIIFKTHVDRLMKSWGVGLLTSIGCCFRKVSITFGTMSSSGTSEVYVVMRHPQESKLNCKPSMIPLLSSLHLIPSQRSVLAEFKRALAIPVDRMFQGVPKHMQSDPNTELCVLLISIGVESGVAALTTELWRMATKEQRQILPYYTVFTVVNSLIQLTRGDKTLVVCPDRIIYGLGGFVTGFLNWMAWITRCYNYKALAQHYVDNCFLFSWVPLKTKKGLILKKISFLAADLRKSFGWFVSQQSNLGQSILLNLHALTGENWEDDQPDKIRSGSALHRFSCSRQSQGGYIAQAPLSGTWMLETTDTMNALGTINYDFLYQAQLLYSQMTIGEVHQGLPTTTMYHFHLDCEQCLRPIEDVVLDSDYIYRHPPVFDVLESWKPEGVDWITKRVKIDLPRGRWENLGRKEQSFHVGKIQGFAFGEMTYRYRHMQEDTSLFPLILREKLSPSHYMRGLLYGLIHASAIAALHRRSIQNLRKPDAILLGQVLFLIDNISCNSGMINIWRGVTFLEEFTVIPHRIPPSYPLNNSDLGSLGRNYMRTIFSGFKKIYKNLPRAYEDLWVFGDCIDSDLVIPYVLAKDAVSLLYFNKVTSKTVPRVRELKEILGNEDTVQQGEQIGKIMKLKHIYMLDQELRHALKAIDSVPRRIDPTLNLQGAGWGPEFVGHIIEIPISYEINPPIITDLPLIHHRQDPLISGLRLFQCPTGAHYKIRTILERMKINFHDVLVGGDGSGGMTSCILRMNPISRVIFNSLLDLNGVELKGSSPSPPSAVACIPEIRDRCVNYIDVWKNPTDLCQVETWEYFLTLKNTHKMSLNLLVFDVETKLAEDLVRIERLLGRYVWKLLGRDGTIIFKTHVDRLMKSWGVGLLTSIGCCFRKVSITFGTMSSSGTSEVYVVMRHPQESKLNCKPSMIPLLSSLHLIPSQRSVLAEFKRALAIPVDRMFQGVPKHMQSDPNTELCVLLISIGVESGVAALTTELWRMATKEQRQILPYYTVFTVVNSLIQLTRGDKTLVVCPDRIIYGLGGFVTGFLNWMAWITRCYNYKALAQHYVDNCFLFSWVPLKTKKGLILKKISFLAADLRKSFGWFVSQQSNLGQSILLNLHALTGENWEDDQPDKIRSGSALHRFSCSRQSQGGYIAQAPLSGTWMLETTDTMNALGTINYDFLYQAQLLYSQMTIGEVHQGLPTTTMYHFHLDCEQCLRPIEDVVLDSDYIYRHPPVFDVLESWKPEGVDWITKRVKIDLPRGRWENLGRKEQSFHVGKIQGFAFGEMTYRYRHMQEDTSLFPLILREKLSPSHYMRGLLYGLIHASAIAALYRRSIQNLRKPDAILLGQVLFLIDNISCNSGMINIWRGVTFLEEFTVIPHRIPPSYPLNNSDLGSLGRNYMRTIFSGFKKIYKNLPRAYEDLWVFGDCIDSDLVIPYVLAKDAVNLLYFNKVTSKTVPRVRELKEILGNEDTELRHALKAIDSVPRRIDPTLNLQGAGWGPEFVGHIIEIPISYEINPPIITDLPLIHHRQDPLISGLRLFQCPTGAHYKIRTILERMKINFHDVLVGGDGSGGMTSCILRMNPISRVIFNSLLDLNGVELKGSSPSPPSAVACIPEIRDRCVNYIDVWKNPTDLCQVETWEYFLTLKNTHKMSLNLLVFDVETKLAEDLVRIERLLGRYVWKLLGRDGTIIFKTHVDRLMKSWGVGLLTSIGCCFRKVSITFGTMSSSGTSEVYVVMRHPQESKLNCKPSMIPLLSSLHLIPSQRSVLAEFKRALAIPVDRMFQGVPKHMQSDPNTELCVLLISIGVESGVAALTTELWRMATKEQRQILPYYTVFTVVNSLIQLTRGDKTLVVCPDRIIYGLGGFVTGFLNWMAWITRCYNYKALAQHYVDNCFLFSWVPLKTKKGLILKKISFLAADLRKSFGWFVSQQSNLGQSILLNLHALTGENWEDDQPDKIRSGSALHRFSCSRQSQGGYIAQAPLSGTWMLETTDTMNALGTINYDFLYQAQLLYSQMTIGEVHQGLPTTTMYHFHLDCEQCLRPIEDVVLDSDYIYRHPPVFDVLESWKPEGVDWITKRVKIDLPRGRWENLGRKEQSFHVGKIQGFAFGEMTYRYRHMQEDTSLFPLILREKLSPSHYMRGLLYGLIHASAIAALHRRSIQNLRKPDAILLGQVLFLIDNISCNSGMINIWRGVTFLEEFTVIPHRIPPSYPLNNSDLGSLGRNYMRTIFSGFKKIYKNLPRAYEDLWVFGDCIDSDLVIPYVLAKDAVNLLYFNKVTSKTVPRVRELKEILGNEDTVQQGEQIGKIMKLRHIYMLDQELRHALKAIDSVPRRIDPTLNLQGAGWGPEFVGHIIEIPISYEINPPIITDLPLIHHRQDPLISGLRLFQCPTGAHYKIRTILERMKINFHDVLVGGDGSGGMTSCILRMNPISRVIFNSLLDLNGVELKGSSPHLPQLWPVSLRYGIDVLTI